MKLLYSIAIGICISTFAFFVVNQSSSEVLKFFAATEKEAPNKEAVEKHVSPGNKFLAKDRSTVVHHERATLSFLPEVVAASLSAVKTVDKTTGAVAGDILTYNIVIANNGIALETGIALSDNIDPNTTLVTGSLKTSPVPFDDIYSCLGNVGLSVPEAAGILYND